MTDLFDLAAAREARDAGVDQVSLERDEWLSKVRDWCLWRISTFGQVSADDVRAWWSLPEGAHHNLYGAVFRDKRFRKIGHTQSKLVSNHAREVKVWGRA